MFRDAEIVVAAKRRYMEPACAGIVKSLRDLTLIKDKTNPAECLVVECDLIEK